MIMLPTVILVGAGVGAILAGEYLLGGVFLGLALGSAWLIWCAEHAPEYPWHN